MVSGFNHIDIGELSIKENVESGNLTQLSDYSSKQLDNFFMNDKPLIAKFKLKFNDIIYETSVVLNKTIFNENKLYSGIFSGDYLYLINIYALNSSYFVGISSIFGG